LIFEIFIFKERLVLPVVQEREEEEKGNKIISFHFSGFQFRNFFFGIYQADISF